MIQKSLALPVFLIFIGYLVFATLAGWWPWNIKVATNPVPTPTPTSVVTPTQTTAVIPPFSPVDTPEVFNSRYFNLSFTYPKGYAIYDSEGEIAVAKDKYQQLEIGRDNAFLRISRFEGSFTYKTASQKKKGEAESIVTIDGFEFPIFVSIDTEGACEGSTIGKITRVVFQKSELFMQQYECGEGGPDYTAVEQQIISTIKFSSAIHF